MNILGISAFYHDSAACLVRDGVIVAAAQEERFTRIKHDHEFPVQRHRAYCLAEGGITGEPTSTAWRSTTSRSLKFHRHPRDLLSAYAPSRPSRAT